MLIRSQHEMNASFAPGGVLAGGLHAVSGPDHLAALLPRIMGQKWHKSMRIGATWGLGHGFSATVIGLAVRRSISALCRLCWCSCLGLLFGLVFLSFL